MLRIATSLVSRRLTMKDVLSRIGSLANGADMDFVSIISMAVTFCLTTIAAHLLLRSVYKYKLLEDGIAIVLFDRIIVRNIQFKNISRVDIISFAQLKPKDLFVLLFFTERWGNRISSRKALLIKKKGIIKYAIITPDNPDEFAMFIRCHI